MKKSLLCAVTMRIETEGGAMAASVFDGGVSAADLHLVTSVDFAAYKVSDDKRTGAVIINGHSLPFSAFLFVLQRAALFDGAV